MYYSNRKENKKRNHIYRKKQIMRCMAGATTVTLLTGTVLGQAALAAGTEAQKEEVVYIITDAQGSVASVNVVNICGSGKVTDYGDYSSVKMLTSTDPIKLDGDKVTFETDKEQVYYQGTMEDTQIPWHIALTYELDGKEVSAEELAGQSGKLSMHFVISENKACKHNYYEEYALQATFLLDTEHCSNITADGATLANVGVDKQISYTVLPGKGLDATIEADVTDFEMDAPAINGIKLNLDVDIDESELTDKVEQIMDATAKLSDGATELSDGTKEVQENQKKIKDGTEDLYSGVSSLDQGISTFSQGVTAMQEGLNTLNKQSGTLTSGSAQMLKALQKLQKSLQDVSVSTEDIKKLTDSSAAVKSGISDLSSAAGQLEQAVSYSSYQAAMKANGLDLDQLTAGNTSAAATLTEQIQQMQQSVEQIKSIPGYDADPTYAAQVAQMEAQISSLTQVVTLLNGNNAALGGVNTYLTTVSDGMQQLSQGLDSLNTQYTAFDAAISELATTLSGMVTDMGTLKSGVDELVANYKKLDKGIQDYTGGVQTIVTNYKKLVEGISNLAAGSKELLQGSGALKDGTAELYDGVTKLCEGSAELSDKAGKFKDETSDMDTQVDDSIDEMIASISGDETEPVSFASTKNKEVKSVQFVIKMTGVEKQETEEAAVEQTQNKSFWEKLTSLFRKEK